MELADDVENRLRERDLIVAAAGDPSRVVTPTRRKITVLGTYIDRLESLLQNPPAKPSVNEEELYRRQDMLLGLRFKTKQMAASFTTAQSSNRASLLGADVGKRSVEPTRTSGLETYDIMSFQKQIVQEQEESPASCQSAAMSTKQIARAVDEELSLHTRLLDFGQDATVSNPQSKGGKKTVGVISEESSRSCSFQIWCLVVLGILVLILFVWTLIKIL